jgi:hypothetical protein
VVEDVYLVNNDRVLVIGVINPAIVAAVVDLLLVDALSVNHN